MRRKVLIGKSWLFEPYGAWSLLVLTLNAPIRETKVGNYNYIYIFFFFFVRGSGDFYSKFSYKHLNTCLSAFLPGQMVVRMRDVLATPD